MIHTSAGEKVLIDGTGTRNKYDHDWNAQLEDPKPNTVYNVDVTHGDKTVTYKYETDEYGDTIKVSAELELSELKSKIRDATKRNNTTQADYGGPNPDYDGGHIIATVFHGPAERVNVIPQLESQNRRGEWRDMERGWQKGLTPDKGTGEKDKITVEINIKYDEDRHPKTYTVKSKVNDDPIIKRKFDN